VSVSDRTPRVPSYRRHTPSGQAVVTLNGRDSYLGDGTPRPVVTSMIGSSGNGWPLVGLYPRPTPA
jgi:hypothetical protein